MRVCPVMGVVPSDSWGRPMSWSLFLPVFETAKLRSVMGFLGGFLACFACSELHCCLPFSAVYWLGMA